MCERNIDRSPPTRAPARDETCILALCPDREENLQLCGVRDDPPSN